jgi:hypothetical protein
MLFLAFVLIISALILTALAARNKVPIWYAVMALALLALLKAWPIG